MADTSKPAFLADYSRDDELAANLGVSNKTLRNWRRDGIGPPFTFIAGRVYYHESSTKKWIRDQEQTPARAKGRTAA